MQQPPNEGQPRPPQQPYYPPGQQYGPPQQPMYQPPGQPPKKRRRWPIFLLIGALLLCVIIGIAVAASSQTAKSPTGTSATGTTASNATTAPTSAPSGQHFKVGQAVKVGDTWQVTVNSAKTSQGDEFITPKAGSQFVIIDVTLRNLSSTEQNISSALNFSLQDATGQKYNETILSGKTPPDGKVEAGSLLRGQLSYEVPTSQKALTFNFEANIISGGQTTWDLKV